MNSAGCSISNPLPSTLRSSTRTVQADPMSRSLFARAVEPLVAISWGIFLVWTVWMTVVWVVPVNRHFLALPLDAPTGWSQEATSYVEDRPQPPLADLRRAILAFAENAE